MVKVIKWPVSIASFAIICYIIIVKFCCAQCDYYYCCYYHDTNRSVSMLIVKLGVARHNTLKLVAVVHVALYKYSLLCNISGSEVAEYVAKHLSKEILSTENYKKGCLKQSLIEAFLKIDQKIISEEVCNIIFTL